ncbi:MAG: nucleoside kinase [Oscillospiraceae bacterium]|nr:nucleoside kinase [Oscillospiraceae bacterium]
MALNYIETSNINNGLANPAEFVAASEAVYFNQLKTAAEKIKMSCKDKPIILLSGPSGSGKTTSSLRITRKLTQSGLKARTIAMDNYFLPKDQGEMPLDENGDIDLESPLRLDIDLFKEHLKRLVDCRSVEVPIFDFANQSRSGVVPITREKNEIIIIEGIHALNPLVTGDSGEFETCIYVSVRTRIRSMGGVALHPENIRLMRRLSRDRLFRGREYKDIFAMFRSVSRGEDLYIMPYKNRADIEVDTFLAHEAPVYKHQLFESLKEAADIMSGDENYRSIIEIMGEIDSLNSEIVQCDSLIREFIGGSSLEY